MRRGGGDWPGEGTWPRGQVTGEHMTDINNGQQEDFDSLWTA